MKLIRMLFWGVVALCLVIVGLANKEVVSLKAMPEALADVLALPAQFDLPLYLVIFASVGLGLFIGFMWEWLREGRLRRQSRAKSRALKSLSKEVDTLKKSNVGAQDDVLALLEASKS